MKWFDCKKGFGFLVDEEGLDVFVHYSVIEGTGFRRLRDGDEVEYEKVLGPKGLQATRVRRITPLPATTQVPAQQQSENQSGMP